MITLRTYVFGSPLRPFASFALHVLFAFCLLSGIAGADSYPAKPIRIIVPYPPGGFNDTLARTLGQKFTEKWGQPVIVDNRPGGGTTIGTNLAAKSVKELIALARSKPGKLNYASAGNGSSNHLSMELFKNMTGVDIVHVPYKGSAPAVTDLIGGQVDLMFDNAPNVLQQVKAGKLRGLAVSSKERSPFIKDLPTVAESGVPGFDVLVWFGVVAPAGTPQSVVAKLNVEINAILKLAEIRQAFNNQGVEPLGGTPREFSSFLVAQTAKWAKVVRDSGAKAE